MIELYQDLSDRLIHDSLIEHTDHAVIRKLALKVLEKHGNIFTAARVAKDLRACIQQEYEWQDGDMEHVVCVQSVLLNAIEDWRRSARRQSIEPHRKSEPTASQ